MVQLFGDLSAVTAVVTSGQRILTKGRIAPALVTPVAGESILKPHFHRDALSPADKSAALCCCGICCLQSSVPHFSGRNDPQNCPFPWRVLRPHLVPWARLSPQFSRFCRAHCCVQHTHRDRHADHAASVTTGHMFALCACHAAY